MRLCLIPLRTEPRNPVLNLERLRERLEETNAFQPSLVCLPECTNGLSLGRSRLAHLAELSQAEQFRQWLNWRSLMGSICALAWSKQLLRLL